MAKKDYLKFADDQSIEKVSEPGVEYSTLGSCYADTMMDGEPSDAFLGNAPIGALGFYTDDPEVFEARLAEIEADLDEVEAGYEDSEKWVTSEQMHEDLCRQFPWLR